MKKIWLMLLASASLGCQHSPPTTPTPSPSSKPYVLGIEAAQATHQKIASGLSLAGTVVADRKVDLASEVSGRVLEVHGEVGQRVAAGQLLVRLRPVETERQIQRDQSQAQQQASMTGLISDSGRLRKPGEVPNIRKSLSGLAYYRQKYENYKKMRAEELVSDQQVTDAYHDYANAKNDYEAALQSYQQSLASLKQGDVSVQVDREKLADYLIYAPFDGYVQECKVAVGSVANQGQPLGMKLISATPLLAQIDVPQQYAASLRPGQRVELQADAASDRAYTAFIERIGASANQTTRTLTVYARISQAPEWMKPGLYLRATIQLRHPQTRLLIPDAAVLTQQGQSVVFTLQSVEGEWIAHRTKIQPGRSHDDWVEVLSGVKLKQWVAASDLGSLQEGTRVKVAQELRYLP